MIRIAIIDYSIGNIKSISNALHEVGANPILTQSNEEIMAADGVILPGVGAFAHGMYMLQASGLDKILHEYASTGKPLMGICLGMQLLFERSDEFGISKGLGLIPGEVKKLRLLDVNYPKLPHVSWNELHKPNGKSWNDTILDGINEGEDMYFVHSFAAHPSDSEYILSTTIYSDYEFCSTTKYNNIYGCQFHPEKSASSGLKIIENFVNLSRTVSNE